MDAHDRHKSVGWNHYGLLWRRSRCAALPYSIVDMLDHFGLITMEIYHRNLGNNDRQSRKYNRTKDFIKEQTTSTVGDDTKERLDTDISFFLKWLRNESLLFIYGSLLS